MSKTVYNAYLDSFGVGKISVSKKICQHDNFCTINEFVKSVKKH